ncbi:FtsX-like permease family protein [Microbacterium sp. A93]|uniref:FtsX-like permease family protein n=1 Tax=unclassified Microbacterium TaxID=2609290 RepID=UPI003F43118B
MSTTLERAAPENAEHPRAAAAAARRGGSWPRRRVELRLASRQTLRAWTTSVLVIALVAIPMSLLAGAATFMTSRVASPGQLITSELGSAQAWFMVVGGEDPTRSQSTSDPYWYDIERDNDWNPVNPELPPPTGLDGLIPDTPLLEVSRAQIVAETPGGVGLFDGIVGDAIDPALDGRYELLDGRRPQNDSEAAASPGTLQRLDAQIGDTVTLTEPAAALTIVGVMKETTARDTEQSLFVAASIVPTDDRAPLDTVWFSPQWQPGAEDLPALNQAGVVAYAHDLVFAEDAQEYIDPGMAWTIAAVTLIIGACTAYLVILLAGAGFAVSARRQQRSLAVVASVGAGRGSIFRIVVLQGSVLGLIGGILGAGIGIGLAYPALRIFDDGAAASFWGFHVPWWGIAGIVLFAVAVGTASAVMPARAATRGDVLSSLRGSRKPVQVRVNRPFWGTLLGIVGIALTIAGGLGLAALNAAETIDYNNPLRTVCVVGIVAGPLLFQIGTIVAGHWLLSLVSRGASRLGLAPRIAARDAAANPARIVPAFAVIAACVFIASFALTSVGVFMTSQSRAYGYGAPLGSVVVNVWVSPGEKMIPDLANAALEQTEPEAIGVVRESIDRFQSATDEEPEDSVYPELFDYVDCTTIEEGACTSRGSALFGTSPPVVIVPDDLEAVLGVSIGEHARDEFAAGGAIVLSNTTWWLDDGASFTDRGDVVLNRWDRAETNDHWEQIHGAELPKPLDTLRVPAQQISTPHPLPWPVILSPVVADEFGYETSPASLIGVYSTPPSQQALDRLALAAGQPWGETGGFTYSVENGPPSPAPALWLILGGAGVLVLGAGGVALGLARVERRPDDATLAAIGASPGIRRRIAFWQALIIVGIGSVTGTIAGVIPMFGIAMQSNLTDDSAPTMADTPWPWLVLLAVGLPLAIAVVSWLLPTRRPDLTRRTAIA